MKSEEIFTLGVSVWVSNKYDFVPMFNVDFLQFISQRRTF